MLSRHDSKERLAGRVELKELEKENCQTILRYLYTGDPNTYKCYTEERWLTFYIETNSSAVYLSSRRFCINNILK